MADRHSASMRRNSSTGASIPLRLAPALTASGFSRMSLRSSMAQIYQLEGWWLWGGLFVFFGFSWPFNGIDPDTGDAILGSLLNTESAERKVDCVAEFGGAVNEIHDNSGDSFGGVVVVLLWFEFKKFKKFVVPDIGPEAEAARGCPFYGWAFEFKSVFHIAKDFFDDIFESDKALGSTVFVLHDDDLGFGLAHDFDEAIESKRFRDVDCGPRDLFEVEFRVLDIDDDIVEIGDPDDFVDVATANGDAAIGDDL